MNAGAPEGRASEAPPLRKFTEGWEIAKPDMVFEMPDVFTVPASGVIPYQFIAVPTHFTEDKWVEQVEVRPGNRNLVHHAIVMVDTGTGWNGEQYLAGYAPGMLPQIWKPGEARLIPAGATLVFQMHYTTNGNSGSDRSKIGIVFAKQPVTRRIVGLQTAYHPLAIPANTDNFRVDAVSYIRETSYLVGMRAHMHLRGKAFQFRAVYPGGESEILLDIPKFDFNWQPYYYLATPKLLPRGNAH